MNKGTETLPKKHLHSRISYLFQAAIYLANVSGGDHADEEKAIFPADSPITNFKDITLTAGAESMVLEIADTIRVEANEDSQPNTIKASRVDGKSQIGPARRLISHLRSISLKGQIRLASNMKHSICKRCNTPLMLASTFKSRVENKSRGGRKPSADVLVITCESCGIDTRFPVGAKRQTPRAERVGNGHAEKHKKVHGNMRPLPPKIHSAQPAFS